MAVRSLLAAAHRRQRVNVVGHRTVAPLLQISTQEERKPHAL
jgi:hypothetical protein